MQDSEIFIHNFSSMELHLPDNDKNLDGVHKFSLPLHELLNHLQKSRYIADTDILLGVEFQNEIRHGKGKMTVYKLKYLIEKN